MAWDGLARPGTAWVGLGWPGVVFDGVSRKKPSLPYSLRFVAFSFLHTPSQRVRRLLWEERKTAVKERARVKLEEILANLSGAS